MILICFQNLVNFRCPVIIGLRTRRHKLEIRVQFGKGVFIAAQTKEKGYLSDTCEIFKAKILKDLPLVLNP